MADYSTETHRLIRYIEKKQFEQGNVRPRTATDLLRAALPGLVIHFNRFKKKFILVNQHKVIEVPIQLPLTTEEFIKVLLTTTYFQMSASKIVSAPVEIHEFASQFLSSTHRIDALNCLPILNTIDAPAKGSDSANVCAMYEEAAAEIGEIIDILGDDDEKEIFHNIYNEIATPHLQYEYKNVDRNVPDRESFISGNFRKMQAGLLSAKTPLDPAIIIPAFTLSLNKHVPRDADGYPMIIEPPKDLTNIENLITSSVKNTSAGSSFRDTQGSTTKQQLVKDSAIIAQNILNQLDDDNDVVPIIPNTVSLKTENIKKKKSGRYFFMESIVYNMLNQLAFGHIIDNQHQIPLTGFFNGLSTEFGIGRYTMQRMLNGIGLSIEKIEKLIEEYLSLGHTIEQISEDLTSLIMTATYDYTNFEFYHHIMVCMIDFFATAYYYCPGPEDHMYNKLNAYVFENVGLIEIHVGNGAVIRAGAAAMASGQLRTLVGNSGRNDAYTDIGITISIYKNQLPKTNIETIHFLNAVRNINKQGDDGFGIFLSIHIDEMLHLFENIHNYCGVKIKPEIRRLLSNHTEKFCNIMTNLAGDFLKYCVAFNPVTKQLAFSRPFQSFLLRMLSPNNPMLEVAKILQTARSFALNAGLCPLAVTYAKKLFDKALDYLKAKKLLTPGLSDKELFIDCVTLTYDVDADVSLDEHELAKQSYKNIQNPNEQTTPNNVVSFPIQDEINSRVTTDIHLISKLVNNDNYYAVHRLNYQIALRYFEQTAGTTKTKVIHM